VDFTLEERVGRLGSERPLLVLLQAVEETKTIEQRNTRSAKFNPDSSLLFVNTEQNKAARKGGGAHLNSSILPFYFLEFGVLSSVLKLRQWI
jgi:hypothetical protein